MTLNDLLSVQSSSSSRMRVMNHNWSATKQRLHQQSVAETNLHSVLSGDRGQNLVAGLWSHTLGEN